jgi:hypothetical protein
MELLLPTLLLLLLLLPTLLLLLLPNLLLLLPNLLLLLICPACAGTWLSQTPTSNVCTMRITMPLRR